MPLAMGQSGGGQGGLDILDGLGSWSDLGSRVVGVVGWLGVVGLLAL